METLARPKLCPECKANWTAIKEMIAEDIDSDDFQLACYIIDNCTTCKKFWWKGKINNG